MQPHMVPVWLTTAVVTLAEAVRRRTEGLAEAVRTEGRGETRGALQFNYQIICERSATKPVTSRALDRRLKPGGERGRPESFHHMRVHDAND
jgi:hypothetical protein